jgi:CBS domain-containing protein
MTAQSQISKRQTYTEGSTDFSWITPTDRPRALTVRRIMTTAVISARPNWSLLEAARTMRDNQVSGLPVLDEKEQLVGILSEWDIMSDLDRAVGVGTVRGVLDLLLDAERGKTAARLEQCLRRLQRGRVSDVMIRRVVTVDPESSMGEAARMLHRYSVRRLPVVEDNRVIGIITYENIVDALS